MKCHRNVIDTFLLGFFGLALGCATPQLSAVRKNKSQLPPNILISQVPNILQTENHCGPASMKMVLQWAGDRGVTLEMLNKQVFTPGRKGTLQTDMTAAARRNGKLAVQVNSLQKILMEVAAQHPVIVLQNLGLSWYPVWHYSVVVGYDLDQEILILHSGQSQPHIQGIKVFERTWARGGHWGLLVLPPNLLPASVPEPEVTEAAAILEESAGAAFTKIIYKNILLRWPQSLGAHIGLANAYYKANNLKLAILELRQAVGFHPVAAPAWHNLAIALHENKQSREAVSAAQQAINTVSSSQKDNYIESFKKVGIEF